MHLHLDVCSMGSTRCQEEGCLMLESASRSRMVHKNLECPVQRVVCFACSTSIPRSMLRDHVHLVHGEDPSLACGYHASVDERGTLTLLPMSAVSFSFQAPLNDRVQEKYLFIRRTTIRGEVISHMAMQTSPARIGIRFVQETMAKDLLFFVRATAEGTFGDDHMSIQIMIGASCPNRTFPLFGVRVAATFSAEINTPSKNGIFWTSKIGLVPSGGTIGTGSGKYLDGLSEYWRCWVPLEDIFYNAAQIGEEFTVVGVSLVTTHLLSLLC